jgi:uncharacterized protein YfaS (alpha-2-macroglobulin family)
LALAVHNAALAQMQEDQKTLETSISESMVAPDLMDAAQERLGINIEDVRKCASRIAFLEGALGIGPGESESFSRPYTREHLEEAARRHYAAKAANLQRLEDDLRLVLKDDEHADGNMQMKMVPMERATLEAAADLLRGQRAFLTGRHDLLRGLEA